MRPINKTAALVVSNGVNYTPNKKILTADSDMPIPIDSKNKCPMKGARRGRLTVLGYKHKKIGRLVCRCDCGVYTLRKPKAINNEANNQDRCEKCRHLAYAKRTEIYRRTGKDIDCDSPLL